MQQISSYLYPNRLSVTADWTVSPLEWKIVYQRTIKLYKGLDNVLEFEFKNSHQKPIEMRNRAVTLVIERTDGAEVFRTLLEPSAKTGIMQAVVAESVLDTLLLPQSLRYSLHVRTDSGLTVPVYSDTMFGTNGVIEVEQAVARKNKTYVVNLSSASEEVIDVRNSWISDIAVIVSASNFDGTVTIETSSNPFENTVQSRKTVKEIVITPEYTNIGLVIDSFDSSATEQVHWITVRANPSEINTGTVDSVIIKL